MAQTRLERKTKLEALEQRVFTVVKKVVDAVDPESLLKLDCPPDEYDSASRLAARAIVHEGAGGLNRTSLAWILCNTFHIEFRQWTEPPKMHGLFFDMADKLLPTLPKIKR
jgi:hypothetical protein